MGERSVERSGSRLSVRRLARRQVAALSLAGLVLLLVTAAALAVTGDLTQPAGTAGCISETGAGPCADGHALDGPSAVAVSPDGKSVYVASYGSNAVARFNRNTTTGAITQPAGAAGCVSETGAGPCADGHGLNGAVLGGGQPGREERLRRLVRQRRRGALQPQHDHRGDHPARRDRRLRQRDGGGALRRRPRARRPGRRWRSARTGRASTSPPTSSDAVARLNRNTTTGAITQPAGSAGCVSETGAGPCADGHGLDGAALGGGEPGREERLRRLVTAATPWRASTATRPPGRSPSPPGPPAASARRGRGPAPTAMGSNGPHSVAVSPDGKSVYVASCDSNAVARLNRNTTTGAITQPAGTAGCVSETGAGPCADGHGLDGPESVAVSPDGKSVYVASHSSATPWRASTATRPPGRSPSPPGPPAASARRGRGPAPTAMALDGPSRWRSARTGRASTSPRTTATPWRASTGRPEAPPSGPRSCGQTVTPAGAVDGATSSSPPSMPISSRVGVAAQLLPAAAGGGVEIVQEVVGVQRVVVEEQEPLGADAVGERQRVVDPGVAPADVLGVLLVGVLAVVDQEVGVASQVVARDPLRLQVGEAGAEGGLVVGDVAERGVAVGDPEAEGRARGGSPPPRGSSPSRSATRSAGVSRKETEQGSSRTSTGDSGAEM